MDFTDQVAVVTGGGKGIGRKLCLDLAGYGAWVFVADIDEKAGKSVVAEIQATGGKAEYCYVDLADPVSPTELIDGVAEQAGRLDMLVNNGGICPISALSETTPEQWDLVLNINLRAVFLTCQAAQKIMLNQGSGSIVNLSSIAGKTGGAAVGAHYAASKAGVISVTKSFAKVLAAEGIRVNAVAPGPVDTPMTEAMPEENVKTMIALAPQGRMATVDEIAGPIIFLLSPEAGHITGVALDINGGLLMI